jgi:prolyl oligopeptidase
LSPTYLARPSRLRVADVKSGRIGEIKLPGVSGVAQLLHTGGDEVLMQVNSFLAPSAWYRYGAGQKVPQKTALAVSSSVDFSDAEVLRDFAISKDGTRVPVNIIRRKGTALDGRNPTLLWGYGGSGISDKPNFSPAAPPVAGSRGGVRHRQSARRWRVWRSMAQGRQPHSQAERIR